MSLFNKVKTINSYMHVTESGTKYLTEPGLRLIGEVRAHPETLEGFLEDFYPYTPSAADDLPYHADNWDLLSEGAAVAKIAGQTCYASFGPRRTRNAGGEGSRYLEGLMSKRHGSVLAHCNYTILIYGVSRALSHELIRHHVGVNVSQLSQRYVGPDVLRFVEHPEIQKDPNLHEMFISTIDKAREDYSRYINAMSGDAPGSVMHRKKVQQTARMCLPACTETALVMTANMRAFRNIIEQRGSVHADPEIRVLADRLAALLIYVAPEMMSDVESRIAEDGYPEVTVTYSKV